MVVIYGLGVKYFTRLWYRSLCYLHHWPCIVRFWYTWPSMLILTMCDIYWFLVIVSLMNVCGDHASDWIIVFDHTITSINVRNISYYTWAKEHVVTSRYCRRVPNTNIDFVKVLSPCPKVIPSTFSHEICFMCKSPFAIVMYYKDFNDIMYCSCLSLTCYDHAKFWLHCSGGSNHYPFSLGYEIPCSPNPSAYWAHMLHK